MPTPTKRAATIVEHLSVEERRARGRAARGEVPRSAHAAWEPSSDRRDPVELLEEQAASRVAGARAAALRTDARVAVYVLPRRGVRDGRRPRRRAADGPAHASCAVTRTCRTSASTRLRIAASSSMSTTSTRRCPGRSSGTSSGWWRASPIAGRDRGFDAKQRAVINRAVSRAYREAMWEHAAQRNMDLWYSRVGVRGDRRAGGRGGDAPSSSSAPRRTSPRRARRTASERSTS